MTERGGKDDGVWAPARRPLTVGLVFTVTLVAFESLAVSTVLPEIAEDLSGLGLYGWVFSAFMLGNLVGIVVAGQEADRVGPARPYLLGLGLFTVGLVVAGAAPSMEVLVGARALQGLGAGALPATAYVAIGRAFPEASRPRMMAVLSTAWVVPALVGPAVSGQVGAHLGWRWVFLGLLPLVLLAAGITLPSLARVGAPEGEPAPSRIADALRISIGTGLVLAALTPPTPFLAPALGAAGVAVGFPALRRLLPAGTFVAAGPLAAAVACRFSINFAFFGAEAFLPLTLNEVRGRSLGFAGLTLTVSGVTWTAGSWIQERRGRVWGGRPLVRAGFALVLAGVVGLVPVLFGTAPAALAFPVWALAGLGMGLAYPTMTLIVLRLAPAGREGASAASLQLADNLGVALGAGLGGALIAAGGAAGWATESGIGLAFALAMGVGVLGATAALRLPRRHLGEEPEPVGSAAS